MAWFHTPLGKAVLAEAAASSPGEADDYWYADLAPMSSAGPIVTPESAMRTSAVFACVRVLAETAGSLPLITYRRMNRGKERAPEHPLYNLLRYQPNSRQTALEWLEMMTAHCALRGNAYAEKRYDRAGRLTGLWPLHPDYMRVDVLDGGRVGYLYTDRASGLAYRYYENEILHLRGLSSDGVVGVSPIALARNSIGLALASEDYGSRFFRNDATPRLLLKHPAHFKDKASRKAFKDAWQSAQAGANRFRTAVLEDGMDVKELGVSNADAQFLETRKFQIADIARIFRVPLVLIGETEKSTSWGSGIEQFMQAFVVHTMRPWLVRWEQIIYRDFLADESGSSEYFAEFLVEALLRGDTKTRYDAYSSAIAAKWMVPNEARELENMNPIEGGDEQVTMPGTAAPVPTSAEPSDAEDQADALAVREVAAMTRAYEAALARPTVHARPAFNEFVRRFYGAYRAELCLLFGRARGALIADARQRDMLAASESDGREHAGVPNILSQWSAGAGLLLRHYVAEEQA